MAYRACACELCGYAGAQVRVIGFDHYEQRRERHDARMLSFACARAHGMEFDALPYGSADSPACPCARYGVRRDLEPRLPAGDPGSELPLGNPGFQAAIPSLGAGYGD